MNTRWRCGYPAVIFPPSPILVSETKTPLKPNARHNPIKNQRGLPPPVRFRRRASPPAPPPPPRGINPPSRGCADETSRAVGDPNRRAGPVISPHSKSHQKSPRQTLKPQLGDMKREEEEAEGGRGAESARLICSPCRAAGNLSHFTELRCCPLEFLSTQNTYVFIAC